MRSKISGAHPLRVLAVQAEGDLDEALQVALGLDRA